LEDKTFLQVSEGDGPKPQSL